MIKPTHWALLGAGVLACAGAQHPGVSTSTDWVRVESPHFTVETDESLQDARKIATYLEQLRGALLAAAWPRATLTHADHAEVVVMNDDVAFTNLFGRTVDALFVGEGRDSLILLHGNPDHWEHKTTLASEGSTSVLKHELVHRTAAALALRQPRWLAEGLAQFLETMQIAPDGKSAQLGMVNLNGLRAYKAFRSVGVADALAWQGAIDQYNEAETAARYGVSWAMVHWMFNAHPQEFARYQVELLHGANATQAWTVAFPNLPPAEADKELFQYIAHGGYNVFTVQIPGASTVTTQQEALRSADVHAIQARLMFVAASGLKEGRDERLQSAREELAAALTDDPNNLAALKLSFGLTGKDDRPAIAHRATTAHPDSAEAWLMAGESMGNSNSQAQQDAFLKAAALAPEDPAPLNALAWGRVTHGQAAQGLPYAMKAAHLAPADPAVLDTLAAAYAGVGRCQDALATEQKAIGFLPDNTGQAEAQGYRERLEKFRTSCAPAPTAAPATPATPPATETPTTSASPK